MRKYLEGIINILTIQELSNYHDHIIENIPSAECLQIYDTVFTKSQVCN